MANVLGGLNFDAKLSTEDERTARDLNEQAIISRFLIQAGQTVTAPAQTGIVDVLNPSQVAQDEVTRPFLVSISVVNSLRIDMTAGKAVTPSGAVISMSGTSTFELARTQAGDINVLFLENELIPSGENRLNDYLEPLYPLEIQNPSVLRSVLLSDFQNTALFPASRLQNIVVVAVVSVVSAQDSSLELQIDMSRSFYAFNRPWYSAHDSAHRSYVGSGEVTTTNPHGTSYNDMTLPGSVPLFPGLAETGLVVSRDRQVNKMTGSFLCTEVIPVTRIKTDILGTITAGSIYGGVGARYIELLSYPIRLGSMYQSAHKANAIAADLVPGSNILVLSDSEPVNAELTVEYTEARALMPAVNVSSNVMVVSQPDTGEVAVAGGKVIDIIPDNTIDMDGTGPYPRKYQVYLLEDRSLVVFPQTLLPSLRLDAAGSGLLQPTQAMKAPARIAVGLTRATSVPGMVVGIEVVGLDINGAQINETVTISYANGYADETLPSTNYDSPHQIYYTDAIFARLDTIQVVSRSSDGPLSEFQLWAEIEPGTAVTANDLVSVSNIYWNGQGIAKIEDARLVSKGYFKPDHLSINALGALALDSSRVLSQILSSPLMSGDSFHVLTEDFEDLKYFDTLQGRFPAESAVGTIVIGNNALIQPGDQIHLNLPLMSPYKTLTAVSGTADPTIGQFQINGDIAITRQNLLAAINDPIFNFGAVGSLSGVNQIALSYNQAGAAGNQASLSVALADSGSIQVQGFGAGFDGYSECYMDRNRIGLQSTRIPSNSDLVAYGFQFRNRYRSRAIGVDSLTPFTKVAVVLHGEDVAVQTSVRVRGSLLSKPAEWLGWQLAAVATPGVKHVYIVDLPANSHKVQVEIYGKVRAYSLFRIVPN